MEGHGKGPGRRLPSQWWWRLKRLGRVALRGCCEENLTVRNLLNFMGWKKLKEHFNISHMVQVREGRVCIGSAYVHDLIRVEADGTVSWGSLGTSRENDDLRRYFAEMAAAPEKVRELLAAPDVFAVSLRVYTYRGGEILEQWCECYDWPNVTHEGEMMYENSHHKERARVVKWARENAQAGIDLAERRLVELRGDVVRMEGRLAEYREDLRRLEGEA